jgi:HlyD family secretion protein
MKGHKRILVFAAAIIAIAAALAWAFAPRAVPVDTAVVSRGRFEQTIDDDGKTRVRDRYVVAAPIGGRMQRIALRPGDEVRPGQVLAVLQPMAPALIDARTEAELQERIGAAQASLARANTAVERARATVSKGNADLARTRQLAKQGFVSAAQLERDELTAAVNARELEALQFERHASEHQLELARAALSRTQRGWQSGRGENLEIRSPVGGAVFRVIQQSESPVGLGTPLIELGDPSSLEIVVDVLSTDAVQIPGGAPVHIERFGGRSALEARVRRVEPSAFTKISALGVEEQRVNVILDIITPAREWSGLADGYRVDARIVVFSSADAITVPVGALFRDGNSWAVFVVRGRTAHRQLVQAPRRNSSEALIENGLAPGDRVILYPSDSVRDGVRVRVLQPR